MSNVRQVLAQNLRALIKKRGYPSVERFAYENGLDKSGIYRTLRLESRAEFETVVEWAKALNVDLNSLYPGKKK